MKKNNFNYDGKKIGVLDQGKDTTVKNCSFENFDIGIKAEGERLLSIENRFINSTKIGKNDLCLIENKLINKNQKQSWVEYWWIKCLVFPLLVILIGGFFIYKLGWK